MKKIKISSKSHLETFLRLIAEESVSRAKSAVSVPDDDYTSARQDQMVMSKKISGQSSSPRRKETEADVREEDVEQAVPEPEKKEAPTEQQPTGDMPDEIKFNDIRDLINDIRSGRSLKDSDIKMELIEYYEDMDEPERIALYKFLNSIKNIVTAGAEGSAEPVPDDKPGRIEMTSQTKVSAPDPKKREKKVAKSKPSPTKKASPKRPGKEDTSPPVPIKVGESQQKEAVRRELSILRS